VIRVKVIDLPREGVYPQLIEKIISDFINNEEPDEITHIELNDKYACIIIVYKKAIK
jgi:hypothetical protein